MKILITTDTYLPSINGVVTSIVNLHNGLVDLGHDVRILTLSETGKSYKENNIIYIGSINANKIYPNVRVSYPYTNELINEIIDWKPDIIHSQSEFSTFSFAKKISKRTSIPIMHTYHTMYEDYSHYIFKNITLGKYAIVKVSKLILNKANCIVAPTEKTKLYLEKYNLDSKIVIIPTGINFKKFKAKTSYDKLNKLKDKIGLSNDKQTLIFIGRIAKEKNIDFLISVMDKIKDSANLLIVGDGPELKELQECVVKNNLSESIFFTGMIPQEDIQDYYKLGNIFVSASTTETQGLTYIEALACGLPLLCKDDPCLNNILVEGVNGFRFQNEDDFINNYNNLIELQKDNSFKENTQQLVEKTFSIEAFVKNIEREYINTIEEYNEDKSQV